MVTLLIIYYFKQQNFSLCIFFINIFFFWVKFALVVLTVCSLSFQWQLGIWQTSSKPKNTTTLHYNIRLYSSLVFSLFFQIIIYYGMNILYEV